MSLLAKNNMFLLKDKEMQQYNAENEERRSVRMDELGKMQLEYLENK